MDEIEKERIKIKKLALSVSWDTPVTFTCENCGKKVQMRSANVRKKERLLCNPCQIKYSKSLRTQQQKEETHKKTVDTCMKKYGVINGGGSEESKQKAKETWKQNWGSEEECFKQRAEKAHNTFLTKYNGSYSTPEIINKKAQTLISNYGSIENAYKIKTEKALKTNKENHRGYHNFANPELRKLRDDTMLRKYGVISIMQDPSWRKEIKNKFGQLGGTIGGWCYQNKHFDSFWEIAFYIFLEEQKIPFVFQPSLDLYYLNNMNKKALYCPGFLIEDKIYEVKGDHLFNKKGEPISCYGENWSNKLKFMENLGVTLITSEKIGVKTSMDVLPIEPFISYALNLKGVPSKYAFIESCRSNKSKEKSKSKILYEEEIKINNK